MKSSAPHVRQAKKHEFSLIEALLPAYLTELGVEPHYKYLSLYWSEAGRTPYLIVVGEKIGGFALIRSEAGVTSMAEFYILPECRKKNVGRDAAIQIFTKHPGPWSVSVLPSNIAAQRFWEVVISQVSKPSLWQQNERGQLSCQFMI